MSSFSKNDLLLDGYHLQFNFLASAQLLENLGSFFHCSEFLVSSDRSHVHVFSFFFSFSCSLFVSFVSVLIVVLLQLDFFITPPETLYKAAPLSWLPLWKQLHFSWFLVSEVQASLLEHWHYFFHAPWSKHVSLYRKIKACHHADCIQIAQAFWLRIF